MNIPDDLNMDEIGLGGEGMKKGVMWKLHNQTDPECPQECVGDDENVSERNGDKDGIFGTFSRVQLDTSSGVILHKKRNITGVEKLF